MNDEVQLHLGPSPDQEPQPAPPGLGAEPDVPVNDTAPIAGDERCREHGVPVVDRHGGARAALQEERVGHLLLKPDVRRRPGARLRLVQPDPLGAYGAHCQPAGRGGDGRPAPGESEARSSDRKEGGHAVCYRPPPPAVPDPPVLSMTLRDGRPVALRPIVPSDRTRLLDGFERLSAASRRSRFLGSVSSLSDATLRYLTEVDHHDHVAWGALDLSDPERPGFGVGRFIRLPEDPDVAEFSLTVLDSAQGLGVGQLLLAVLATLAPTVGVRVLRGVVGRENERMTTWLHRLGAVSHGDGQDLVMDLSVPVAPGHSPSAAQFADTCLQIRHALDADLGADLAHLA